MTEQTQPSSRVRPVAAPRRLATALSLAVVFSVLVFVFPLRVLVETATHFISGGLLPGRGLISSFEELRWTYVIYGLGFALLSGLYVLLFEQARRALDPSDAARPGRRPMVPHLASFGGDGAGLRRRGLFTAARRGAWLPGVTYQLIPLGIGLFALWERRQAQKV